MLMKERPGTLLANLDSCACIIRVSTHLRKTSHLLAQKYGLFCHFSVKKMQPIYEPRHVISNNVVF